MSSTLAETRFTEAIEQLEIAVNALDQSQAMLRDVDRSWSLPVQVIIDQVDKLLNDVRQEYGYARDDYDHVCPKCGYRLSRDGAALCNDCYQKEVG